MIIITYCLLIILTILYSQRIKIFISDIVKHKKNKHGLLPLPFFISRKQLTFKISFSESSKYAVADQIAGNKIFGITTSLLNKHHKNSVRFIWRYYLGEFQIGVRFYINGEANNKYFSKVNMNEDYVLRMECIGNKVICSLNDEKTEILFNTISKYKWFLFPYFGGSSKPNKNIEYKLKYIN